MTLAFVLEAALVALVLSAAIVFTASFFLRRLPAWPKENAWPARFFATLFGFVFLITLRNGPSARADLEAYGLIPWTQILIVLFGFSFLIACIRVTKAYLWRVFDISHEDNLANRMRQTQLQFIEKLLIFVLVVISLGTMLLSFESAKQFGTSLLASAGLAGLIFGVASKQLFANVLAGMQLAFAQPIRIDDAVVIEGEWGWIEEITLTYVVVRIWDLRRLIVPLSRLLEQPFQNWTRTSAKIIGSVHLQVSYQVDVDELRAEVDRILARTPLWDGDVKVVQVVDSHVHTMEIRILVTARTSPRAWDLRCFVREQVLKYLAQREPAHVGQLRVGISSGAPAPQQLEQK